ncbi:MAG TPA: UbiD family decarboxylase [Leptospiraceae bacterium]|nr:UbiD family decarboxylase [Leptospiraceae bacterium]HMW06850.1 UbiD family decarboxylase [Leptospiraceae bacterium]HMX32248.1 UbiD family decarboxylase [Leptospiraceae bacterium]HMY32369.1 UbiD family decarboxylase [Leptospiraceae bacterium]HNA06812.1 UbiD family decarboxylase [Leptospiraceae bacterium]
MNLKPIHSTREFIDQLKKEKELLVINDPVNPDLEIAEIQRRVVAKRGPAILFTNVIGSKFSVATNLYGSARRIHIAFGSRPVDLIRKIAETAQGIMPPTPKKIWEARGLAFEALKVGLKKESSPRVLESSISPVDIMQVPALRSWPMDGGRFITLPLVYTESPVNGKGNLGMYRIQFHDNNTTGMHIQIHRGGGFHYFEAEERNLSLPCHIYVGGPPAMTLAAVAPMPEELSELIIASLLLGERLKITRDKKVSPLPIVSDSDFVFIGAIPPKVRMPEGPFGDHYGYYALKHDYPIMKVHSLYHRKDAIWPATVVGRPPQEDHFIAEFLQDLLSPMFPLVMPKVVSVWAYEESGVHSLAATVVKERYHKEAFTAALRILGEGHLSLTKCLLVTNENISLKDFRNTFITILERIDLRTDVHILSNISQDTLDYTGPKVNSGSKMILLGIGDKKNELVPNFTGKLKNKSFHSPTVYCPGVLVVSGPKYKRGDKALEALLKETSIRDFLFVFLVDDAKDTCRSDHDFIWNIFTRFEPAGDVTGKYDVIRNHIAYTNPIVIDCRLKDWYPPVLVPDPSIVARVDERFGKILDQIQSPFEYSI